MEHFSYTGRCGIHVLRHLNKSWLIDRHLESVEWNGGTEHWNEMMEGNNKIAYSIVECKLELKPALLQ